MSQEVINNPHSSTVTANKNKLFFKHLPKYAQYLLDNKLEELVKEQLRLSRELDVPVFRLFSHMPEEEILQLSTQGCAHLLNCIIENNLSDFITEGIKKWKNDEIPMLSKDQLAVEDITQGNYIRKKSYLKFLHTYTTDVHLFAQIIDELDEFVMQAETQSFNTYVNIKQEEISRHLRFIQKVADITPSLITTYNINTGKFIFINDAIQKLLGYELKEALEGGVPFFVSVTHPDDLPRVMQENAKVLEKAQQQTDSAKTELIAEFRYRMRHKNGQYHWFHTYGTVFDRNADNQVEHVLNISMDITEEYALQQELEKERKLFESLIENSPEVIIAYDTNFCITVWNKQCEKLTGVSREGLLGKSIYEVIPFSQNKDWVERTGDILKACLNGKEYHFVNQKYMNAEGYGDSFYVPLKDVNNNIFGVLSIIHDTTPMVLAAERMTELNKFLNQKNEELRISEERYHNMIDQVQDYAIILLSKEGEIQNWNKGAENIKGYKAEEIIGKRFNIFYTPEGRAAKIPEKLLQRAREEGKAADEGWRVRKDGSAFWGSIVITALHNEKNEITGFSKVTRDLTERRMAEDKLAMYATSLEKNNRELESNNKELSSFNYVASHDLQEPLRKISTFTNRIFETESDNLTESAKGYFDKIRISVKRMQQLLSDLLEFSRTHTIERHYEPIDLNNILSEVLLTLKEAIDENKVAVKAGKLPVINGINFQMHQLFTNLLSNSIKYRKPAIQPLINIRSKTIDASSIPQFKTEAGKKYIQISFTDNGIGFEQQHAERIFEVFQRLHTKGEYEGTGIGLSICKKIMENHNGFIEAHSQPDKGTTFDVYFPVD